MTASKGQIRTRENLFRPRTEGVLSRLSWFDHRDPIAVHCHGCGAKMEIESTLANIVGLAGIKKTFYPCPAAPYICASCRSDKIKLTSARDAMFDHFRNCQERKRENSQVDGQAA